MKMPMGLTGQRQPARKSQILGSDAFSDENYGKEIIVSNRKTESRSMSTTRWKG